MGENNYWQRRLNRRRFVGGTAAAGTALAAISLVGCGGGSSNSGAKTEKFSNIAEPQDTSKDAKRGGVISHFVTGDETTLDPLNTSRGAGFGGPAEPGYSRLLTERVGPGKQKEAQIIGDLAESFELANDGLTMTVKLRPDAKWDQRPPTNSRPVDADDVVFTVNKFFSVSPYASQLSYAVDSSSPVQSVQKIDSRTVQFKLAFPWSPLLKTLAHGNLLIQPREADGGGFNVRTDIRGSAAWMLQEYQTAISFKWRRNPNWHGAKDFPFLDGYDEHVIPEYATRLSQFRAKNVDAFTPRPSGEGSNASDLIQMVKEVPELKLYQGLQDTGITSVAFGSRPGAPFYDVRLRRAVSMSIDRDLLAFTESGGDLYEKAGIPFPLVLDSHLASSWDSLGYWLDPKDTAKWGDAGKYWKYDPAEAKKLVEAAGFARGLDVEFQVSSRAHSSPQQAAVLADMMSGAGIRGKINVVDYNTIFLPKIWVPGPVKGDYDGLTFGNTGDWQPHVASSLYISAHTKGSYTSSRKWDPQQDKLDSMIEQAAKIFDEAKLRSYVQDIQKEMASYMSGVSYTYGQQPYHVVWPWVQNYLAWRSTRGHDGGGPGATTRWLHTWIDTTKKA